ncbi:hypothetical protein Pmani_001052 [Petrolisthes manimaculis]|uniref:NACHT domain-containing protein n=1 Tax=Petrolisthes manimaculis TaxID=1843537 RepID=A0AAE1QKU2_9EUCA|nr:hypothetical protein Pmani_001052 [Petrolisthes manimaculis]
MAAAVGSREKSNALKMNEALKTTTRDTFWEIFKWATPDKDLGETISVFKNRLDINSPVNYYAVSAKTRKFNKEQEETMSSDPSCRTGDITLLHKLFKLFALNVAKFDDPKWNEGGTHLESLLTRIKNIRNKVAHNVYTMSEAEFGEMGANLKEVLTDALKEAKERYNISDDELQKKTDEMIDGLFEVFNQVLGKEELLRYHHQAIMKDLVKEAKVHIAETASVIIDPLHFLPDSGIKVKVPELFFKMQVKQKDIIKDSNKILSAINPNPSHPQLLLIEGEAGSGKSTLLTMITHDWLEGGHGQIKGLDKYSLVLRVQCRDSHLNSLTNFLNNALPKVYCRYKNLMLPIMKDCRILLLIDGLDEANTESWKLVKEILNEFKYASTITLLFTSRPEPITDFMSIIPTEYEVSQINLLGINEKDRKKFIFNYINVFKHIKDKTVDFSKLQQTIETICVQDHFKIPLNLVFLAWQCIHDPSSVTASDSQTQLYFWAHKLNVQKLKERLLNKKPELADIGEMELTRLVEICMEALYQSMLQALINNQAVFTEQELLRITSTCATLHVSSQEVLSVFFSKKTIRTPLGDQHQYSALHKGVQEYYGALHVVKQLRLQPDTTIKEEVIRALESRPFVVKDFQYIFLHLAGLLHHHISPVPIQLHEEVVQLLKEAGVDSWGRMVEAAGCNTGVINVIIQRIPPDTVLCVEDHVTGHAALLSQMEPTEVVMKLSEYLGAVPDLTPMIGALTRHNVTTLELPYNFWYPQETTKPDSFHQALMSRDELTCFVGQWHGWMNRLPLTLQELYLTLAKGEQIRTLLPVLQSLTQLKWLHVVCMELPDTPEDITTSLPDTEIWVIFRLSGLAEEEIDRACQLVAKLQPKSKGYYVLRITETKLSKEGWERLLEGFVRLGVSVRVLTVPEVPDTEDPKLEMLCRKGLGGYLRRDSVNWLNIGHNTIRKPDEEEEEEEEYGGRGAVLCCRPCRCVMQ